MAFSRNFVKAKVMRSTGSGIIEPGWCQKLVKTIGELRTYRGDQLLDALEMIVERPFGDACRLHDGVHRESLRRALRKKH